MLHIAVPRATCVYRDQHICTISWSIYTVPEREDHGMEILGYRLWDLCGGLVVTCPHLDLLEVEAPVNEM